MSLALQTTLSKMDVVHPSSFARGTCRFHSSQLRLIPYLHQLRKRSGLTRGLPIELYRLSERFRMWMKGYLTWHETERR